VPRESFDASENLSKEALRQVAFGQLQDEVPGMSDETPAGLEEPLLETRQRPALNRQGDSDPTREVAEVVGDDPEQQSDLGGPEPMAGESSSAGGGFALVDPLLHRPALVAEADDGPVRPGERGDDEADPGEELFQVMLDLGDHPPDIAWPERGGQAVAVPIEDEERMVADGLKVAIVG